MSYFPRRRNPVLKRGVSSRYAAIPVRVRRGRINRMMAAQMASFRRNRVPKGAIAPFGGRKELKYVDTNIAQACDTTGAVTALNLLAVGDDNNTRDGREVTIKSVQLNAALYTQDSDVGAGVCRVVLVWDNAVNSGTIATIAQIFTAATDLSSAFPLIDNNQRFTILWDSKLAMGEKVSTATQAIVMTPNVTPVNFYKKLNCVTKYSGTSAAIGSIQNGGLLLVTFGRQATGAGYSLVGSARVRFTDN